MTDNTAQLDITDASLEHARQTSAKIEAAIDKDPSEFRVLTGARPTGNLHIGHYFGALRSAVWIPGSSLPTIR